MAAVAQKGREDGILPFFFSHPSSLSLFSPSSEQGRLPLRLSSCLVVCPCSLCRLLPIPAQSIQLSKFLLDPIRAHVSESQAGKLLEPPPPAPLPIDYADTKGCVFCQGEGAREADI